MAATVVTRKGREVFTGRMIGASPTQAEPKILCQGLDPADAFPAANTDIALFTESGEARVTGTSSQTVTTTTNDTYQVTGTITATATRAITEASLADSTTQPAQGTVATGTTTVIGSTTNTALTTSATFSPGNNNYIQIRTEVMLVTAGSGSTALTVTRAQNGSTAISTIAANDNIAPGNPPGQTGITGGTLLTHADFAVINLNTNDSIAYTWKISVS